MGTECCKHLAALKTSRRCGHPGRDRSPPPDLWQSGHGHDIAANGDNELGARREPDFANGDDVMFRSAFPIRIGCEAVLSLRDADGEMAVTLVLQFPEAIANFLIADDVVGLIYFTRNGLRFFPKRHIVGIKWLELRRLRLDRLDHRFSQLSGALATPGPVIRGDTFNLQLRTQ